MVYPDYKSVELEEVRQFYENLWDTKLDPKRGLTVVEIIDAILADEIKGMYVMGENPAMSDPDQTHARKALAKLRSDEHTSELQSLMRNSYAVFCLNTTKTYNRHNPKPIQHTKSQT